MHTGYVGVTTFQMLTHLYDNYGIITAVDIENSDEKMRTSYNPALPTESLFHQIEVVVSRSLPGLGYKLDPDKTWKSFKIFFTTSHHDLWLMQTAAKQTGLHTNNTSSYNIVHLKMTMTRMRSLP